MRNRIAIAVAAGVLAAGLLSAADIQAPTTAWANCTRQLSGELQLARTTAEGLAATAHQQAADVAPARDSSIAMARSASAVQSLLYQMEQLQQARSVYDDARFDRLKEDADKLSELAASLRAAVELNPAQPRWSDLHQKARLAARTSAQMSKAIEKLNN